jgi:hypothetical protein
MSDAKSLQLIGTRGEPNGLFRLSYGTDPTIQCPSFSRSPHNTWRTLSATEPADIQKYAEQNADKLKAIATFEKGRGFTTHTLD